MDEDNDDFELEAMPSAAGACVQDLIALAHAHEEITDRQMRKRLLAAADQVLALMTIEVHPTTLTKQ